MYRQRHISKIVIVIIEGKWSADLLPWKLLCNFETSVITKRLSCISPPSSGKTTCHKSQHLLYFFFKVPHFFPRRLDGWLYRKRHCILFCIRIWTHFKCLCMFNRAIRHNLLRTFHFIFTTELNRTLEMNFSFQNHFGSGFWVKTWQLKSTNISCYSLLKSIIM